MRAIVTLVAVLLSTITFAQTPKVEYKKINNNLTRATYYFADNEQVVQKVGYFDEKGKLDGIWTVYDIAGNKLVEATYKKGKKDGVWIYYQKNQKIKVVTYKDNKMLNYEQRDLAVN